MAEEGPQLKRDQLTLFAAGKDDPRRRRIADVWLLILAAVLSLITGLIAAGSVSGELRFTDAAQLVLGWMQPFWTVVYNGAMVLMATLVVLALYRRRWELVRDIVVAAVLAFASSYLLSIWINGSAPELGHLFWGSGEARYPELRLAALTAVTMVATPDLTRPFRRFSHVLLGMVAVASLVLGGSYVSALAGGIALGVAAGAVVRLVFGSTAGFPTAGRVRVGLAELGVAADDLRLAVDSPPGAVRYEANGASGPMAITVYGRDARDTQLLSRLWRSLWYRHSGPHTSVTRSELVEHEALMLYAAADAGVFVPKVVTAGTVDTGDSMLITEEPRWSRIDELEPEAITDDVLDQVWQLAALMHRRRIAHGALNLDAFRVIGQRVGIVGWTRGRLSAPKEALSTDTAELLVSCSMRVGEERTLRAAEAGLARDALDDALPYIQRAALTPALREAAKDADVDIESLRKNVASTVGEALPEVAELRRISIRDVLMLVLVGLAAYALISQLADVGIETIIEELQGAEWSWILFAILILQLTLVGEAYASIAAVGQPLPFGPTTLLQSAIKFIGLTVPSAAGRVAVTTRYLTRQGVPTPVALTQGAIDSLAGFAVQLLILLTIVPFLDLNLDFSDVEAGPMVKAGVVILVVGVLVAIVFIVVPKLRKKVQPFINAAWTNIKSLVSSPKRLVKIIAGNFGVQLCYAIAMGACLRAVGAQASIGELLVINTLTSLLSGLVPVPSGIGVAEFAIASGMTAVGVPPAQAFAATLIYRLFSAYLPPVPGYFSLRWLSNHGFV